MNNQQLSDKKINNGLLALIKRHPSIRPRYIKGTQKELEKIPGARVYHRFTIAKIVNDQAELNPDNRVIKTAFLAMYYDLYPEERVNSHSAEAELMEA